MAISSSGPKSFLGAVARHGHALSHVLVLQEAFLGRRMGCLGECWGSEGLQWGWPLHPPAQIPTALLFLAAVHTKSPPLAIVRRFIHLLEQSQHDFWEESEVLRLQEEVVKRIRANRRLESDLDLMDIKIGLLVKNRITLQVGRVARAWLPSVAAWPCLCFAFEAAGGVRDGLGSTGVPLALPETGQNAGA